MKAGGTLSTTEYSPLKKNKMEREHSERSVLIVLGLEGWGLVPLGKLESRSLIASRHAG